MIPDYIIFFKTESPVPDPRSGHRIVALNGNLYSLGGYNPTFWTVENDEESNYPLFREVCDTIIIILIYIIFLTPPSMLLTIQLIVCFK